MPSGIYPAVISTPAVFVGLWLGGRFPASQLAPYIIAQVLGGIVAVGILYLIASGQTGFDVTAGSLPMAMVNILLEVIVFLQR